MAGKIKDIIDKIIDARCQGQESKIMNIKVKLILKGIYPDRYDENSIDDEKVIEKLKIIANDLEVKI